jgi:hypothetical protein
MIKLKPYRDDVYTCLRCSPKNQKIQKFITKSIDVLADGLFYASSPGQTHYN